jgi:hypothetical protein
VRASPTPTMVMISAVPSSQSVTESYEVPRGAEYRGASDQRWQWWNEMERLDSKFEWKIAINFYGVVVDQDERPISGAKIRFQWTDLSPSGVSERIVYSDPNGRFSLAGEKGKNLGVYVTHDGYHALKGGRGTFEYAAFFERTYHQPDRESPVVFRMLKKTAAQPLLVKRASAKLAYDSADSFFDFEQGTLGGIASTRSGLRFAVTRAKAPQGQPFDWSFRVTGVGATVRQTFEEFPQTAPDEGYANEWESSVAATSANFQGNCTVRLYVRTSDGKFGWVDIELMQPNARELGSKLTVTSHVNPTGSRSVE